MTGQDGYETHVVVELLGRRTHVLDLSREINPNHLVHGERGVPHTEIVANIDRIPRHAGFYVMILPLRFQGLTGSPVRALALWTDEE